MPTSSPLHYLLQHFEKPLLAGFLAWLFVVGTGFAGEPAELRDRAVLAESLTAVGEHMRRAEAPPLHTPPWVQALSRRLDPAGVPRVPLLPAWTMHKRPGFLYWVEPPRPRVEFAHGRPVVTGVDASERGRVVVRWERPAAFQHVIHTGYELWRIEPHGERRLATFGPETTEHVDRDVAPRARYAYRVVSTATLDRDDRRVREAEIDRLPAELLRSESEVSVVVETKRETYVVVNQVTVHDPIRQPAGFDWAYLYVYHWNAEAERFVRKGFRVRVGEEIGSGELGTEAVLEKAWIGTRAIGPERSQQVQWVRFRFPGREPEEANDRDLPEELRQEEARGR